MSKKVILWFFVGLLILPEVFVGCRKGENDPIFSFRTRKARLTGDWNVDQATWTHNDTTWAYDGTDLTVKVNDSDVQAPIPATYTWKFEGDGTYEHQTILNYPDDFFGPGTLGFSQTTTINGIWSFAGGDGDTKTKSRLLLQQDKIQVTQSNTGSNIDAINIEGPIDGMVYDIDMLKNKEMTWLYDQTLSTVTGQETRTGDFSLKKD